MQGKILTSVRLPIQQLEASEVTCSDSQTGVLPISVIVPVRNEAVNLPRCLESLRNAQEVYVVDSRSTDDTGEIARKFGARVVQFQYHGGWPKKRQWAMDALVFETDWILLLDADEAVTPQLEQEIREAINNSDCDGYYLTLQMDFLGRQLQHCGAAFQKLALFRRGKGRFECRLKEQDSSMCDMEVHEHIVIEGKTGELKCPVLHRNVESLFRYIRKHNEYSNWEARVWLGGNASDADLPASLFGNQAQRRRWLKRRILRLPGSALAFFLYRFLFKVGFLDGVPGFIYCMFQAIQWLHIKAKICELEVREHQVLSWGSHVNSNR